MNKRQKTLKQIRRFDKVFTQLDDAELSLLIDYLRRLRSDNGDFEGLPKSKQATQL